MEKISLAAFFALISFLSTAVHAQQAETTDQGDEPNIEFVIVTGVKSRDDSALKAGEITHPGVDNSDLLRLFPGGNRNSNGPVTRISQYRGMYGAQNNVSVDGRAYTSGGPNWMDSPLSSIPQSLTQSVTLYRGLGSVASIEEGLGGSIEISSRKGDFSDRADWSSIGLVEGGYVCICTTDCATFALKLDPGSELQTNKKQMVGHISVGHNLMQKWGNFVCKYTHAD